MSFKSVIKAAFLLFLGFQLSFAEAKPVELERRCLYTGSIRLRHYANNTDLGWVGNIEPWRLYWTTNSTQKLPLSFTYQDPDTSVLDPHFDEAAMKDTSPGYPFVGLAGSNTLSSTSAAAPYFTRSNAVPYGPPQTVGNADVTGGSSQTFVWKLNPITKELTGIWTNPNGTVVPTFFYTNPATSIPEIRMSGYSGTNLILRKIRLYFEEA
ncbi:hypothetical protein BKA70DRAFT_1235180 [Coprinopsis sp. MPI-PUGE-AT-0042]|nr:hypothetical protein BKA70DRAFT_1235180 [Coprinopsis sp. MPI-PUGE-AT-0042]